MPVQITSKSLVSGSQQLEKALAALAEAARGEMAKAMLKSGAKVVQKYANKSAPRPEIEVDDVDDAGGMNKSIGIGLPGKKWRWRFAEYGVQPFEVDLAKGRTTRTSGSGRKVKSSKKAMRFVDGGAVVFTKRIKRGGIPAKPFLRPAIDENEDEILDEMAKVAQARIDQA